MTAVRRAASVVATLALVSTLMPVAASAAPPAHRPVRVSADLAWVDTGIAVAAGDALDLVARGQAKTGPLRVYPLAISGPDGQVTDCIDGIPAATPVCALDGAPYGALIARVASDVFLVGANGTITAGSDGVLELAVNDNLGTYGDNTGGYIVFIN